MKKHWLLPFFVMFMVATTTNAHSEVWCRRTAEPGKRIDGRFMGIPYLMIGHVLAEKYCGAASRPIKAKILSVVNKLGCGPGTEIYNDIEVSLSEFENLDIAGLASAGSPTLKLSPEQVSQWAQATTETLGGCAALVRAHNLTD